MLLESSVTVWCPSSKSLFSFVFVSSVTASSKVTSFVCLGICFVCVCAGGCGDVDSLFSSKPSLFFCELRKLKIIKHMNLKDHFKDLEKSLANGVHGVRYKIFIVT